MWEIKMPAATDDAMRPRIHARRENAQERSSNKKNNPSILLKIPETQGGHGASWAIVAVGLSFHRSHRSM
jgi:hypothetical protein